MHAATDTPTPRRPVGGTRTPKQAPSKQARKPLFASTVVINANAHHASVDREFMRRAGVTRARTFYASRPALEYLREHGAELVILGDRLDDMSGLEFLRRMRDDRALAVTPVLFTSQDSSQEAILDAAAAGCSGYLVRPYSARSLAQNLIRARRGVEHTRAGHEAVERARQALRQQRPDKAVSELDALTTDNTVARKLYETGCDHLGAKRFDEAIDAFQRAVAVDRLFAEAHLGLSEAWKAKGFPHKARLHAEKAAQCYARMERHAEAKRIWVDVLKATPPGGKPLLETSDRLVRSGLLVEAAHAAAKAVRDGDGSEVMARLKRACHFTTDPEATARQLADALAAQPGMPGAEDIMRRLLGEPAQIRQQAPPAPVRRAAPAPDTPEWWAVIKYVWHVFIHDEPMPRTVEPLEI